MNVIAHNLSSMNTGRYLSITTENVAKSTEKLSSGFRINRAADDAAGLTISEKLRYQIRGLNKGYNNIQDGISMINVADGALAEVTSMLHRMSELSIQASNDTNTDADRVALQQEVTQLINEIDRIGSDTTFNGIYLFADPPSKEAEPITKLVSSPGASKGYLTESYEHDGKYYPSASLDFSKINASNISQLNGGSFVFTCSQSCSEVFDVTFTTDGTPSSAKNLIGSVRHIYSVDISNCKTGADVVNTVYDYIKNNPTSNTGTSLLGGLKVSHSNDLLKSADGNKLIVARNYSPYSTAEAAQKAYPNSNPNSGKITYTELEGKKPVATYSYNIQCSSNPDDNLAIQTRKMNSNVLGIDTMKLTSFADAQKAITQCSSALDEVSDFRSALGAYQNRLEHAYRNVDNTAENLTAAESRLRDVDMAKESVELSLQKILEQAGQAMLSQANSQNQGVLSLLQ